MCWQATQTYPCDVLTPRHARRFVAQQSAAAFGNSTSLNEVRDLAEIVTSELVTNAYNARGNRTRLTLAFHRSTMRVAVQDDAPGVPRRRHAGPQDESGRGLQIVATLARDWGVDDVREGKQVWAELALPTAATASLTCRRY
ncbi:MAG TPA: ATP-binding protein [Jatrophihabitantaceae bacterium]|nr:ATP-binding protein [Jatrophihabitantaceae bacterium]